ncbi:MAG: P-loop NTPase, partial [Steroidobacteraceae bacterium]
MSTTFDPVAIEAALGQYLDPNTRQTWAEARVIRHITSTLAGVQVTVELGYPSGGYEAALKQALESHLAASGFAVAVELKLSSRIVAHAVQRGLSPLPGIANVVAVASGKGGVGKSTVAVNLALAWARQGARVGMLDADIYGPSQPIMLGLQGEKPGVRDGKQLIPPRAHGVAAMSIGFLVDIEQPMVWRGPMVTSALNQLLAETDWGELDYLVVGM